ncbi:NACHT domain-containing protein [Bacteroides thetaiotaomicron]|uniref:NACHT domain-containing protein n=1 Tax=Bacteroides thetaiotaomicron TaxID=818 RepID=UPI0035664116
MEYIIPKMLKHQNLDGLLENANKENPLFDAKENPSIDRILQGILLQEKFVCIVGEPGIGKSRLVEELKKYMSPECHFDTASHFKSKSIDKEYCIIDALDEVDGSTFHNVLFSIRKYKDENPNVKVFFTCRKHYVASYANHFATCNGLNFIEICRLSEKDVMEIVNKNCSNTTKENVDKSSKLKELLTIPRYLTFLLKYDKQKGGCSNVGELFEYMISSSIQTAIDTRQGIGNNENIKILIKRVLEKVAFIMEISRKDFISIDDLYTILDGVKGNMAQMLIANLDLLFFKSRILKETNGILQFENTELQEYLAAKELCRQDNIESVLYDVAVHKELKHIHPNWYDVIPHVSYTEDKIQTFINVFKLIVSYESNLEYESFQSLLRYVDPSILSIHQKEELFSTILKHYLRVPAYIQWRAPILKLMQDCYTPICNDKLMQPADSLNKIQLANISAILEAIVKENKLGKDLSDHWTEDANSLMKTDDDEKLLSALNLYQALRSEEELIHLSKSYKVFTKGVKEKYCEVTGYGKITDTDVVDCWLEDCYVSNPYAINAVLHIENLSTINYAYNKIVENDKLRAFFNPKGSLLVYYELWLNRQFNIAWNADSESRKLMTRIIASLMVYNRPYTITHAEINGAVKKMLLDESLGILFVGYLNKVCGLADVILHFHPELVDTELLISLNKLLYKLKIDDESQRTFISDYLTHYAKTNEQRNKESEAIEEKAKIDLKEQSLITAYQSLSEPNTSACYKYEAAFELSKNIDFVRKQDSLEPLVDVITKFFDKIDLNEMTVKKTAENSFTLSMAFIKIPYYIKVMYHLGKYDLLQRNRIVLLKILPMIRRCALNSDDSEIKEIYKSVLGSISEKEKSELVEWWKSREDDFVNISPEDVFTCITDYGIDTLSYKLEEYVEQYIANQSLSNSIAASKALDIISKGYCNWNFDKYRDLFNILKNDDITSIKMLCNAIMVEQFQDPNAITWRIDYLKNHIVKSNLDETGHIRAISVEESEMMSQNPRMFKCFMNIKEDETLVEQLLDLFDFSLSLCTALETQEYSSYLLKQIYLFFVNTDKLDYLLVLRKKVEKSNAQTVNYITNNIMSNAEMSYLTKENTTIDKAIKQYNKCIEEAHLEIRNDGDLRRYFTYIHSEVQKEIQDQGIYSLVRQELLNEDFIQRELKNTIINKCCQLGLEAIQIDREVATQDNKRPDFLIRYGLCNPIMIELKLLNNKQIQNDDNRKEYKNTFELYKNATNACLSVFWVFNVYKKGSDISKFNCLDAEYKSLDHTLVLLTDCKCSSGNDTGIPRKSKNSKSKKTTRNKR